MIKKILSKIGIEEYGWYELCFVMYPILAGYSYGHIPMSVLMLVILAVVAFFKGYKPTYKPRIIIIVFAYVIFHDILSWLILPYHPSYIINNIIVNIATVFALYYIVSVIDYRRYISMIYLVTIATLLGVIYHVILIRSGQMVEPIRLPFMPKMESSTRAFEEGFRPKSFFWEPAACVTFLMVPFFISLLQKRWIWVFILLIGLFLTTSTNGIVLSTIILCTYIFTQNVKLKYKFLTIMLLIGMSYLFFATDLFEFGRDKMLNTELEENARLSNGPLLILSAEPINLVFGVFNGNAFDYIRDNNISTVGMQIDESSMFVPTFWNLLLNYGVVGLMLYLNIFITLYKSDKRFLPYVVALIISFFVQSIMLGANFVFQIISMLIIINYNNESTHINYSKC